MCNLATFQLCCDDLLVVSTEEKQSYFKTWKYQMKLNQKSFEYKYSYTCLIQTLIKHKNLSNPNPD